MDQKRWFRNINAENKKLTNLAATPTVDSDAVSFGYLNLYLPKIVYGDVNSDYHFQTRRLSFIGTPTAPGDATTKTYVDTSIFNETQISTTGGIKRDVTNKFELNVPQAQALVAPVLLNGSIIKDGSGVMSVDVAPTGGINKDGSGRLQLNVVDAQALVAPVLAAGGVNKDGAGKLKIDVPTAQGLVAPVLAGGGVDKDGTGKLRLVDSVVRSIVMLDNHFYSWATQFIENFAAGHWLISDNTSAKVGTYGVLSGTNVESLQYQGFGERKNIVKYSDAERPTSGTGLINGRYNYVTFDGTNDRMKCDMDLNITSGDKTLSITVVYRLTSYGNSTGTGLKNAIIGHDNTGWDHFICMNDS